MAERGSSSLLRRLSRKSSGSGNEDNTVSGGPGGDWRGKRSSLFAAFSSPPISGLPSEKAVWLDCDPGHDDAIALLLAVHHPDLRLVGVSTVAGNAPGRSTYLNAAKLLVAFGAHPDTVLLRGADEPLVKPARKDAAIHGQDGLGGVVGLPALDSPEVLRRLWASPASSPATGAGVGSLPRPSPADVCARLAQTIRERRALNLAPLHLCVTGPCTNIALFIKTYPELVNSDSIAQIVVMGGSAGAAGNRGPMAEFNILVDPEAASIVFNAPVKVVMAGLNVTHQAIFTPEVHDALLQRSSSSKRDSQTSANGTFKPGPSSSSSISGPSTLRKLVSSAMTFFASTYAQEFDFIHGPPVHDMLVLAYVIEPRLFYTHDEPTTGMGPLGSVAHRARSAAAGGSAGWRGGGAGRDGEQTSSRVYVTDEDGLPLTTRMVPPKRYAVRVETAEHSLCVGATVVDFYDQWGLFKGGMAQETREAREYWGRGGRNVEVLEEVDTDGLWDLLLDVVQRAERALAPKEA